MYFFTIFLPDVDFCARRAMPQAKRRRPTQGHMPSQKKHALKRQRAPRFQNTAYEKHAVFYLHFSKKQQNAYKCLHCSTKQSNITDTLPLFVIGGAACNQCISCACKKRNAVKRQAKAGKPPMVHCKRKAPQRERQCKEVGSTDTQTNKNSQRFLFPCEFLCLFVFASTAFVGTKAEVKYFADAKCEIMLSHCEIFGCRRM